jgi:hypothetical protein
MLEKPAEAGNSAEWPEEIRPHNLKTKKQGKTKE